MKSTYNMYYVVEPVFFPRQLVWNKKTKKLMKTTHIDEVGTRSFNKMSREVETILRSLVYKRRKQIRFLVTGKFRDNIFK